MTVGDLDIRGLLRLLAVHEAGSFAQAARDLGISRQSVHRTVDELEHVAGGPLLDRSTRDLRPTTLGRQLLAHAATLRALQQSVRTTLQRGGDEPSGVLNITSPPLFAETVLADATARFAARWPAVRVRVAVDSGRTNLLREDHDLMIRVGTPPDQHYATQLGTASLVLCASPEYLARHGPLTHPAELGSRPVLEFGRRPSRVWSFTQDATEHEVEVASRITSESPGIVTTACLAGVGILRCPVWAARPHVTSGRLVLVLNDWDIPEAGVWAVYGHRTSGDATLRAFVEALRAVFETWAAA